MTPSKAMRGGEGREQWRMDRMWMMREEDAAGRTSEAGTLVPVCWRDMRGRDRPTTAGRAMRTRLGGVMVERMHEQGPLQEQEAGERPHRERRSRGAQALLAPSKTVSSQRPTR